MDLGLVLVGQITKNFLMGKKCFDDHMLVFKKKKSLIFFNGWKHQVTVQEREGTIHLSAWTTGHHLPQKTLFTCDNDDATHDQN